MATVKTYDEAIRVATSIYGKIYPCIGRDTLRDCVDEKGYFWFNSENNSTHIIKIGK